MLAYPNAKINIGLFVKNKRNDGYHNIETLLYPVAIYDMLEIIPAKKFSLTTSGIDIHTKSENNICYKAFNLLKNNYNLSPVKIHLHKNIPVGAGLGGGSSDAAFSLKLINKIFELNLTENILLSYAQQLGSDVPFFIKNKPALAKGKGEILTVLDLNLKNKFFIVVYPNFLINTSESYSNITPKQSEKSLKDLISLPINMWKCNVKNDFEKSLFSKYIVLKKLKNWMYDNGALYASMSGSGSSIYGIFDTRISIKDINLSYRIFQCKLT